jgi:hypothetical protein
MTVPLSVRFWSSTRRKRSPAFTSRWKSSLEAKTFTSSLTVPPPTPACLAEVNRVPRTSPSTTVGPSRIFSSSSLREKS